MKREKYIDVAKGFGILLVVYCHTLAACNLSGRFLWIVKYITSFHMPLFFFISGYCLGLKKDTGEKPQLLPQLKKLTRNLLLPYIVWSGIYMFLGEQLTSSERLKAVFTGRGIAPLWFLAALFLCEFAFVLLKRLTYKLSSKGKTAIYISVCILCFCLAYAMWHISRTHSFSAKSMGTTLFYLFIACGRFFLSMPLLILGYIISQAQLIQKAGKLRCGILGGVFLVLTFAVVFLSRLSTNLHLFRSDNMPVLICTAILGSMGVLMLAYSLGEHSRILNFLGSNSLAIMILHYTPFKSMYYSNMLVRTFTDNPYIISILATAITMAVTLLAVWLVKKKFFLYK